MERGADRGVPAGAPEEPARPRRRAIAVPRASPGWRRSFALRGRRPHATAIAPQLMEGSPFRFVSVPAILPIADVIERLNALQPDALFGYASMLAGLASGRRAGRLRIRPAILRSTSETLLPGHRAAIA